MIPILKPRLIKTCAARMTAVVFPEPRKPPTHAILGIFVGAKFFVLSPWDISPILAWGNPRPSPTKKWDRLSQIGSFISQLHDPAGAFFELALVAAIGREAGPHDP